MCAIPNTHQGNKYFAGKNYELAIDSYTKAISKNPTVPHYYTNRALSYLNQKRYELAIKDSKVALEKDPNLIKGHFILGRRFIPMNSINWKRSAHF